MSMMSGKKEIQTELPNEKPVARYKSVFDPNTVVYEFENHFRVYVITGTGERLVGIADKERSELPFV